MANKPTYEELEQRVKELEKEFSRRMRAEEALRESEEKFRSLASAAHDAMIMMDRQGNISYWNEAAGRIFGYTKTEVIGRQDKILQRLV